MEWVLFFILQGAIAGAASLIVSITLREPLSDRLAPALARTGRKRDPTIQGKWVATFDYGPGQEPYVEVIEISSLMGAYVGRIVPDPKNYDVAAEASKKMRVRVRGSVKDNRYFTGQWIHPSKESHMVGGFQLLILTTVPRQMIGQWVGYSETRNQIEAGSWVWRRQVDGNTPEAQNIVENLSAKE